MPQLVNESVRMTAQLGDLTNALEEKTAQVTNLQDEIRSLKAQVDAGAIPATAGLRKRGVMRARVWFFCSTLLAGALL